MFKKLRNIPKRSVFLGIVAAGMLVVSGGLLWAATLSIPDIAAFETRKVAESTKIYDRTGEILLYDVHENIRRTVVEGDDMSEHIRNATIAIEDEEFYSHPGIDFSAIVRAVLTNIKNGDILGGQGGSTITQQVIKNSLLTNEKKISRKVKEWILAIKLEGVYEKDEILTLYLNEIPYGGNIYGIEEAAQAFFGKTAADLEIAESAYLAALPQAPTFFSPYGSNVEALEERKNTVLLRMYQNGFIDEDEYNEALEEDVRFAGADERGLKAGHFVMYIREYLEETYGEEAVREAGLKVITTLDYELQQKIEDMVYDYIMENQSQFDMENASVVVTDPNTGQIIVMVGSRKYSDEEIDGAVNVATRPRQPGSTFKPFAYVTAFKKGFTPDTIIFDVRTQFSTNCEPFETAKREDPCFSPENYDFAYSGPVTMRTALAASKNIPAVKTLYLAGQRDSIRTAASMGITTLDPIADANLSLVLGSGEVKLLEMTNAYGVFANGGIYHEPVGILEILDKDGETLEEFEENGERVLPKENALQITEILADRGLRVGTFGAGTALDIPDPNIAVKTGTTNNYVDVWTIGYNTNMSLGIWGGNNDASPVVRRVSTYVIAPLWRKILDEVVERYPSERFERPGNDYSSINKPILTGSYQGGIFSGNTVINNQSIHSILHWVDTENPRGPVPSNPNSDSQYAYWEYAVRVWAGGQKSSLPPEEDNTTYPLDDFIVSGLEEEYQRGDRILFEVAAVFDIDEVEASIEGERDSDSREPYNVKLSTDSLDEGVYTLKVTVLTEDGERLEQTFEVEITD
ncbi:MAG: transglycosylase domain-containing protein [Candidatus Paceibacterota bacterium]